MPRKRPIRLVQNCCKNYGRNVDGLQTFGIPLEIELNTLNPEPDLRRILLNNYFERDNARVDFDCTT